MWVVDRNKKNENMADSARAFNVLPPNAIGRLDSMILCPRYCEQVTGVLVRR